MFFREIFKNEISDLLNKVQEPRRACIFPKASLLLKSIISMEELELHGKLLAIYEPYPEEISHEGATNWFVILRMHPTENKLLQSFMQLLSSKNRVLDHIFVSYIPGERTINPSRLFFSENSQMLTILESNICFAQLEENIFSLELEDSFSDIFLHNDLSVVSVLLSSINVIESLYTPARNYVGKGKASRLLADRILKDKQHSRSDTYTQQIQDFIKKKSSDELDTVLLLDRTVDPVTPISFQKTYHGMLDEALGSDTSNIIVDKNNFSVADDSKTNNARNVMSLKTEFYNRLYSTDSLIPGMSPQQVNAKLSHISKTLFEEYTLYKKTSPNSSNGQSLINICTMKNKYETLNLHFGLLKILDEYTKSFTYRKLFDMYEGIRSSGATKYGVVEEIEKLINMAYPIEKVLRLLCLCSLMDGGIRTEDFYRIKRYILDAYGLEYMYVIENLVKLGLLCPRIKTLRRCRFLKLLKMLEHCASLSKVHDATQNEALIIKKIIINLVKSDPTFKYSPGSKSDSEERLRSMGNYESFNKLFLNNWPNKRLISKLPDEPYFEYTNTTRELSPAVTSRVNIPTPEFNQSHKKKIILIVFIGGCTYTEIAAINSFSKSIDNVSLMLLTTNIISGDRLIKGVIKNTFSKQFCVLKS